MNKFFLLVFASLLFFSCSENEFGNNEDLDCGQNTQSAVSDIDENKELCMQRFSQILSKAVSENQGIRAFLKEQALKKNR